MQVLLSGLLELSSHTTHPSAACSKFGWHPGSHMAQTRRLLSNPGPHGWHRSIVIRLVAPLATLTRPATTERPLEIRLADADRAVVIGKRAFLHARHRCHHTASREYVATVVCTPIAGSSRSGSARTFVVRRQRTRLASRRHPGRRERARVRPVHLVFAFLSPFLAQSPAPPPTAHRAAAAARLRPRRQHEPTTPNSAVERRYRRDDRLPMSSFSFDMPRSSVFKHVSAQELDKLPDLELVAAPPGSSFSQCSRPSDAGKVPVRKLSCSLSERRAPSDRSPQAASPGALPTRLSSVTRALAHSVSASAQH